MLRRNNMRPFEMIAAAELASQQDAAKAETLFKNGIAAVHGIAHGDFPFCGPKPVSPSD